MSQKTQPGDSLLVRDLFYQNTFLESVLKKTDLEQTDLLKPNEMFLIREEAMNLGKFMVRTDVSVLSVEENEQGPAGKTFIHAGLALFNPGEVIKVILE